VVQFILGFWAQTSAQKSLIWWASKHRHHHRYSDTDQDVHSPHHASFVYSHVGWIFARKHDQADLTQVADLTCYPELMWLPRHELLPATIVAGLCFWIAGWSGLVVGFFWSTVLVYHATFCINSLAHLQGSKQYVTGDNSRNNALLAFFTMGEGWHNNHHAYQSSARQGFHWWEVDPTYHILRTLSWIGLVWDLKVPPEAVVRNEHRLGVRVINRAAEQLAARFNADPIALVSALHGTELSELQRKLSQAHDRVGEAWTTFRLPQIPTRQQIKTEASKMFARTPSLDAIVDRAAHLIRISVGARLRAGC
jgi:stearoyl-CoA desaturase (delta-9 desaturase)